MTCHPYQLKRSPRIALLGAIGGVHFNGDRTHPFAFSAIIAAHNELAIQALPRYCIYNQLPKCVCQSGLQITGSIMFEVDSPFCSNPECRLHVRAGAPGVIGQGGWAQFPDGRIVGRDIYCGLFFCDECLRAWYATTAFLPEGDVLFFQMEGR